MMAVFRSHFWAGMILITLAVGPTGCGGRSSERTESAISLPIERIDRSLSVAAKFLIDRQGLDGAWRSDTYGPFKDGGSLTPLVLEALRGAPSSEQLTTSSTKGADYLAAMVQADGAIQPGPHGLSYPVYTSAGAVRVLSHPENARHLRTRNAWLAYLRQRQLTEDLGWQPPDKAYGGWSYANGLPHKPKPGELMPALNEANLSATVFALEALRSAGCPADDPVITKALIFIQRCQNYSDDAQHADPRFDDGGFFFIYDDPVRNKAGVAGTDSAGHERFFSYGSTSADGLRGLLACGCLPTHPRVRAARQWLETNFSADSHPGKYATDRESARPSVYHYYCCSVAQAFQTSGIRTIETPERKIVWAEVLADHLIKLQRPDGSWINSAVAQREDDPLVATSLAAAALAACRSSLTASRTSSKR